ncbi:MAG: HEAT repeat domain-containing protein [Promethearchaeia archaeon]
MIKTKLLPEEIYKKRDKLGLDNTVYLLVEIIDKERDISLRRKSVKYLGLLSSNSDQLKNRCFDVLEDIVITEKNQDVKREAAKSLGNLKTEKALEPLKWILENGEIDLEVRLDALKAVLKIHPKEEELELLIQQLQFKSKAIQEFIKNCILDLNPQKCIAFLLNSIRDKSFSSDHKISIIELIGSLLADLPPTLKDENEQVLEDSEVLSELLSKRDELCKFIGTCLEKKDVEFNDKCLLVFDTFEEDLKEELVGILKDGEFLVKKNAINLIGKLKIKDEDIIRELFFLIDDLYNEVSREAIRVLGKIGDESCVPRLLNALNIEDETYEYIDLDFKWNILDAVKKIYLNCSDASFAYFHEVINSRNYLLEESVAYLMGEIGKKQFINPLLKLIKERNLEVRKNAIIALGKIGSKNTIEPLIQIIQGKSTYWLLKKVAVDAIYNIFKQNWEESLNLNLDEGDKRTFLRAKQLLADYLDVNPKECFKVKMSIINFLGKFGDKLVLDTLKRQQKDFHRLVHINATKAIESIQMRLEKMEEQQKSP